jgi:anti-sigma factor RsiW
VIDPCKHESLLSAFLDGALPSDQERQVSVHLAGCDACRRKLAALQKTDDLIRDLPTMTPSAGFDAAFWSKVAALEEKRSRPSWMHYLSLRWQPLLAAGLAACVIAGFLAFYHPGPKTAVEDAYMAENMEMLNHLDLMQHLDLLENWDAIQKLKEQR